MPKINFNLNAKMVIDIQVIQNLDVEKLLSLYDLAEISLEFEP